ncbi:MAG: phage holin family protein [Opitutales bacterium]
MSLLETIAAMRATLLETVETRLSLFSAEVELEQMRIIRIIWISALGGVCLFLSLLSLFGIALHVTPDRYDYLVYIASLLLFGILTVVCLLKLRKMLFREPKPFAAISEELKKDAECLHTITKS